MAQDLSRPRGYTVEVFTLPDGDVGLRDSTDPDAPVLRFAPDAWRQFVRDVRLGIAGEPRPCRGPDRMALSRFIQE